MKVSGRALLVMLLITAAGCSLIAPAGSTPSGGEVTPTTGVTEVSSTPVPTVTPAGPMILTIWLPPQFDPNSGTPAGNILKQALQDYQKDHPEILVEVRVKAPEGPAGLLESLAAAEPVAPAVVPSIIALQRPYLEIAALKGMIYPLDAEAAGLQDADWFTYARDLARVQDTVFGLPFAGDALVLLYRPGRLSFIPSSWEQVLGSGMRVSLSAGDPQALTGLALYLSTNGPIQDDQGRPLLELETLTSELDLFARGLNAGVFTPSLTTVNTDGMAWQNYRDGADHLVVSWASRYLTERPADTTAAFLPGLAEQSYALADGWTWAVSDPLPARRLAAVQLAKYLSSVDFLKKWSQAAGYLPVRPSSLDAWTDFNLRDMISRIAQAARLRPANDLVASLGMVLQAAIGQVLSRQADPQTAAQLAVERLLLPKNP